MPSEPNLPDMQGIIVLAREIIVPGRTIYLRDIRAVRIRRIGPAVVQWLAIGMLLLLAATAAVYTYIAGTGGVQTVFLLGGSVGLLLGAGLLLVLYLPRKALIVITPQGEIPIAFASRLSTLEPVYQAIRSAAEAAGGAEGIPSWGSALQAAANQPYLPPSSSSPPLGPNVSDAEGSSSPPNS